MRQLGTRARHKTLYVAVKFAASAALTALFLAFPVWAEEPQASQAAGQVIPPTDTDWNNLQRLPLGALLLVERTDGTQVKGRLVGLAEDALSMRYGRGDYEVLGVARASVRRIWLFGERKTAEGALAGAVVGGIIGAGLGAGLCDDERGWCIALYTPMFAGMWAGIGAALGATIRERTLIYRAPPAEAAPTAENHSPTYTNPSVPPESLPAPLRDVYRTFSAEQAARELSRELAHAPPPRASQPPAPFTHKP